MTGAETKQSAKFPKKERLCSRKVLDALFTSGESFAMHPVRVVWLETELPEDVPVQVVMSVPKKRVKKAVERNQIKRQMQEAWRMHKWELCDALKAQNKQWALMLIYTGKAPLEHHIAQEKIILILQRLIKTIAS